MSQSPKLTLTSGGSKLSIAESIFALSPLINQSLFDISESFTSQKEKILHLFKNCDFAKLSENLMPIISSSKKITEVPGFLCFVETLLRLLLLAGFLQKHNGPNGIALGQTVTSLSTCFFLLFSLCKKDDSRNLINISEDSFWFYLLLLENSVELNQNLEETASHVIKISKIESNDCRTTQLYKRLLELVAHKMMNSDRSYMLTCLESLMTFHQDSTDQIFSIIKRFSIEDSIDCTSVAMHLVANMQIPPLKAIELLSEFSSSIHLAGKPAQNRFFQAVSSILSRNDHALFDLNKKLFFERISSSLFNISIQVDSTDEESFLRSKYSLICLIVSIQVPQKIFQGITAEGKGEESMFQTRKLKSIFTDDLLNNRDLLFLLECTESKVAPVVLDSPQFSWFLMRFISISCSKRISFNFIFQNTVNAMHKLVENSANPFHLTFLFFHSLFQPQNIQLKITNQILNQNFDSNFLLNISIIAEQFSKEVLASMIYRAILKLERPACSELCLQVLKKLISNVQRKEEGFVYVDQVVSLLDRTLYFESLKDLVTATGQFLRVISDEKVEDYREALRKRIGELSISCLITSEQARALLTQI